MPVSMRSTGSCDGQALIAACSAALCFAVDRTVITARID